jgi:hypothetical protein
LVFAFETTGRGIINLCAALFARSDWQRCINLVVHVDLKQPVLDLLLFVFRNEILHWHVHIVRRRNVRDSELIIFRDGIIVRVFDDLIDVKISVEENRG